MNKLQRKQDAKVDVPKEPEIPADVKLLAEIRDQMATLNNSLGGRSAHP
jgi:large conductance mechanosensitive channel